MARDSRPSPLMEQVRRALRVRHYSIRTEQTYVHWIKRYIHFHDLRHPAEMGEREVAQFLTHLAVEANVAASTQNQALNALVFLYKRVLEQPLGEIVGAVRAKRPKRLPVVLTQDEVRELFHHMDGVPWLVACVLYGSGLRITEGIRLRVKDLEFKRQAIIVRDGKGTKDRVRCGVRFARRPGGEKPAGRRDPRLTLLSPRGCVTMFPHFPIGAR